MGKRTRNGTIIGTGIKTRFGAGSETRVGTPPSLLGEQTAEPLWEREPEMEPKLESDWD